VHQCGNIKVQCKTIVGVHLKGFVKVRRVNSRFHSGGGDVVHVDAMGGYIDFLLR
jgi:hypothetical protein